MARYQLPAYAPLPLRALLGGLVAQAVPLGDPERRVIEALLATYATRSLCRTDSGTTALTLAMRGAIASHAGPIALPAYCCYDVASAAVGADARVCFYDVDDVTLQPDLASLERVLTQDPAAVVVAHLYGIPVPMAPVRRLVESAGVLLIEDAAQASGASVRGRPVGGDGSVTVLSFGRGKGVTSGRGGALLANDDVGERLVARVAPDRLSARGAARDLAVVAAQWLFANPVLYRIPASLPFLRLGETVYREPRPARVPSRATSGVLAHTLSLVPREAERRRRHAARLRERMFGAPSLRSIEVAPNVTAGYLRFPVQTSDAARRARLVAGGGQLGIASGYPKALVDLEVLTDRIVGDQECPGARSLAGRLLTLPVHSRLGSSDLARLDEWISTFGWEDDPAAPVPRPRQAHPTASERHDMAAPSGHRQ